MATEHFTMSEMLYSETAVKKKIWNGATREQEQNLQALMSVVLEPLRLKYGKPITVSSGFRNEEVNKAVGGVATSQHMAGEAADITAGSTSENRKLARLIVEMHLPFDQLIDENGYKWVHVSFKRVGFNRGQVLRYKNKKYVIIRDSEL
ncbi:MAG: peptidase M15 [Bacteroidales bacterium]|nr:peptidase M15 [Bacteroidales bacterium]